jgi:amidohydrolase
MRKTFWLAAVAAVLGFCPILFAAPASVDKKTAAEIDREIEKVRGDMIKVRRFIHMNPQTANRETETAKIIASKLAALGLDIKTGVARTGVVALLRGESDGPTVALRAGMDAVSVQETAEVDYKSLNPGIMHATGNDLHAAIVLGAAHVLSTMKDRIKGNVKFIFQPASEGAPADEESGAALMIKEGVLENPSVAAVFALHSWPEAMGQVFVAPGDFLASSDSFEIVIRGRSALGSQPQAGVDAIVIAAQVVSALQSIVSRNIDPIEPALLTVGRIEGGTKAGLIADRVRIEGIVRAMSDANRKKIARLLDSTVKGIVHAMGGECTLSTAEEIPPVSNHPLLLDALMSTLMEAAGERNVNAIKPQMMADDFGFFSQKTSSLYILLGVRNPRLAPASASLYNPAFNPDERAIAAGIRILCSLVVDWFDQQSRLSKGES